MATDDANGAFVPALKLAARSLTTRSIVFPFLPLAFLCWCVRKLSSLRGRNGKSGIQKVGIPLGKVSLSLVVAFLVKMFGPLNFVAALGLLSVFNGVAWGKKDSIWVDTWVSMPQLTEPANLPPAPFVSVQSSL